MGQIVHGIQVRHQPVAQAQGFLHDCLGLRVIIPGLLAVKGIVTAVEPKNGRKGAQLQPAGCQFIIPDAHHVTADVMTPPGISHVGGADGEVGLEVQRSPGDKGIARKAHRIAVTAKACIAGEDQGSFPLSGIVQIVKMVQHPQRIQSLCLSGSALLPVDPPEVHPVLLMGMADAAEVGIQEMRIGDVEFHFLFGGRIDAHLFGHGGILFLKASDAVGGMHI